MKTHFAIVLLFAFLFGYGQDLSANSTLPNGGEPDVKIVVGQKKIWFVADEIPLHCTSISVSNLSGEVVLEKHISSKTADWSLDISGLPSGEYVLKMGGVYKAFKRG